MTDLDAFLIVGKHVACFVLRGKPTRRGHSGKKRESHPCWKGGSIVDRDGYVRTWAPDHPWPRSGYINEHVRVMELKIGRRILSTECVHHKDHNRKNNSLENLILMLRSEHSKLHRKKDAKNFKRDKRGRWLGYT